MDSINTSQCVSLNVQQMHSFFFCALWAMSVVVKAGKLPVKEKM